jgi:2-oxoisovalerate dehydrogenase E2 component (dihydrolipoyl transacylase)
MVSILASLSNGCCV